MSLPCQAMTVSLSAVQGDTPTMPDTASGLKVFIKERWQLNPKTRDTTMTKKIPSVSILNVLRDSKGQGLVEYALILVLIAVVVIAAVKGIGSQANSTFSSIGSSMNP